MASFSNGDLSPSHDLESARIINSPRVAWSNYRVLLKTKPATSGSSVKCIPVEQSHNCPFFDEPLGLFVNVTRISFDRENDQLLKVPYSAIESPFYHPATMPIFLDRTSQISFCLWLFSSLPPSTGAKFVFGISSQSQAW